MQNTQCLWCGKLVYGADYCNTLCRFAHQEMLAKPIRAFYSYRQASEYLGRDTRTIRKFEGKLFVIDKTLPNRHAKLLPCRGCGNLHKT
jgi:hypothetical protein